MTTIWLVLAREKCLLCAFKVEKLQSQRLRRIPGAFQGKSFYPLQEIPSGVETAVCFQLLSSN